MFIEGEEGPNHHSSILDGQSNSEIDPLKELALLCGHNIYFIIDSRIIKFKIISF